MIARPSHCQRPHVRAFTLIELLVVVVILGILMAVAVPTFLRQQTKAQDSKAQQQLDTAYRVARGETAETGNLFPAVGSLVSAIRQSEPELSVTQGSCQDAASDKTIVEDSAISSSKKIYLYTKSTSGTFWRLTADATNPPMFSPLASCTGPLATTSLSSSTNAITDQSRKTGQGDGLANDSSYGAWEGTTNQVVYGSFENGATTGWHPYLGGGAVTSISASQQAAKFGSWSLKVVTGGAVSNEGTASDPIARAAAVPGQTWTASAWVYDAKAGDVLEAGIEWFTSTSTYINGNYPTFTSTGGWQHVVATGITPANTAFVGNLGVRTTTANATTVYLDGLQLELKPVATPYVDDNGATNARASSVITAPASGAFTGTQGWMAMRVSPGWQVSKPPAGGAGFDAIFDWTADANNWIGVQYREAGTNWKIQRTGGGTPASLTSTAAGFANAGDRVTVIAYWTATEIGISVNGSAFVTTPAANPAVGMPAMLELGSKAGGTTSACDCNLYWFAAGSGTLTNSDASTIAAWGDRDPTPQDFAVTAQAKETWAADDATVVTG